MAAAAILILAPCLAARPADATKVTAVRFWTVGDVTRIAVETTGTFEVKSDQLSHPERVFFDLAGTRPEIVRKGMHVIPVGNRILKQIRVAETEPGVTRIVLDLESPAQYVSSQLVNPNRLMIELRPATQTSKESSPSIAPSVSGGQELTDAGLKRTDPDLLAEVAPNIDAAVSQPPPTVAAKAETAPPPPAPPEQNKTARLPDLTNLPDGIDFSAVRSARLAAKPLRAADAAPKRGTDSGPTPLPARRNTDGARSLTRVLGLKLERVVLDPGHGGHDAGTNGPGGLLEKDLVLDVARHLGALIEDRLGSEVIYTRNDDTFVPLEERTRLANDKKADLFLSIHANSSPYRYVSGVETYYLNFTTSKTALDVAARENASSQLSIYDLKDLLRKIALKDKIEESREFANCVQTSLQTLAARTNSAARNKDRGIKKAPFVVLIGASMPSVLAEVGFLSNAHDENQMKRPEYRQKIAEALYKGVANYAATLSHFQVAERKTP
ncbi:MAG: N-acetylmuramoyl-L-alanine amidase [Bryobacteraceae bacterium]